MDGTVLLIEDEPNIIEAITFLLKHDGWTVVAHSDGADALDVINRHKPDMLILDVMLPGRSGYEILRDLRANPETGSLPVLMLTAKGQDKDREAAASLGADVYMTKPFANQDMLDTVRKLVSS